MKFKEMKCVLLRESPKPASLTSWVHSHTGDPLAVGHELFCELLFNEVVDTHIALCGHKEVRPDGMERDALHHSLVFTERILCASFAYLVDHHL